MVSFSGEESLWQLHRHDYAKDYRYGGLDGCEPGCGGQVELTGDEVVGEPEYSGPRNEGEYSAKQEDRAGAFVFDSCESG